MKILPIFVLLACVASQACAQDDESSRPLASRGLLKRGQNPRAKATTTTTPAPQEEVEYDDDAEYPAEEAEPSSEAPPSSTEGKKLVGAGVRPFRSNTDLLETLKKRRQQAIEDKKKAGFSNPPAKEITNEEVPAPSKPSRGRFGRPATRSIQPDEAEEQPEAPAAPTPVRGGRAFLRRGNN